MSQPQPTHQPTTLQSLCTSKLSELYNFGALSYALFFLLVVVTVALLPVLFSFNTTLPNQVDMKIVDMNEMKPSGSVHDDIEENVDGLEALVQFELPGHWVDIAQNEIYDYFTPAQLSSINNGSGHGSSKQCIIPPKTDPNNPNMHIGARPCCLGSTSSGWCR